MKKIKVYIAVASSWDGVISYTVDNVYCFTSRQEMLDWAENNKSDSCVIDFFEDEIEIKED